MALVLGIETSCDETSAAVVADGHLVRSNRVASQIEIHRRYGGVVPELASRNHVVDIVPVVEEALSAAGVGLRDLDAIAVTRGPGLVGALLVGLQTAKSLAYAAGLPLVPVHHLAGHLHAVFLHEADQPRPAGPAYPHLALCVSGGHTALYVVEAPLQVRQIANTRDDAAGEAFDKVARMLGLGYPGGPVVERGARGGDGTRHRFTPPRFKREDAGALDFSFSGLKTAVLTVIQQYGSVPRGQDLADLLASFQAAAVEQLVERTFAAAQREGVADIVLAGGVACNTALRERMRAVAGPAGIETHAPPPRWCTDNAAMIAGAADAEASRRRGEGSNATDRRLNAVASWPLGTPSR